MRLSDALVDSTPTLAFIIQGGEYQQLCNNDTEESFNAVLFFPYCGRM
jgi:hypothetical protein